MRKLKILLGISMIIILSCKENNTNENTEKRYFSSTEVPIQQYRKASQSFWDIGDSENALKYNDSIKAAIVGSYIEDHNFTTYDSTNFSTYNRKKPLFLQVTASWCKPCLAEIPALNKIVEKYKDRIDFTLIFWDNQEELSLFAQDYNSAITLVPSLEKQEDATTIDIAGFRHIMGFPTNYLISSNNQIINFSQGAMVPDTFALPDGSTKTITKKEANDGNFKRLEKEVIELLKH